MPNFSLNPFYGVTTISKEIMKDTQAFKIYFLYNARFDVFIARWF